MKLPLHQNYFGMSTAQYTYSTFGMNRVVIAHDKSGNFRLWKHLIKK